MGSVMSAIRDDEAEYEALCKRYGEPVQWTHGGADCYGAHADSLRARRDESNHNQREGVEYAISLNGKTGSFRCFTLDGAIHIRKGINRDEPKKECCVLIFKLRACPTCGQFLQNRTWSNYRPCQTCKPPEKCGLCHDTGVIEDGLWGENAYCPKGCKKASMPTDLDRLCVGGTNGSRT